jgi:hypothetical protein
LLLLLLLLLGKQSSAAEAAVELPLSSRLFVCGPASAEPLLYATIAVSCVNQQLLSLAKSQASSNS